MIGGYVCYSEEEKDKVVFIVWDHIPLWHLVDDIKLLSCGSLLFYLVGG